MWIKAVAGFRNLVALHSVNLLFDWQHRLRVEVLKALIAAVPSLRRMDVNTEGSRGALYGSDYLEIVRGDDGTPTCCEQPESSWVDAPRAPTQASIDDDSL